MLNEAATGGSPEEGEVGGQDPGEEDTEYHPPADVSEVSESEESVVHPPPPKRRKVRTFYTEEEEEAIVTYFGLPGRTSCAKTAECTKFLAEHQVGELFSGRNAQNVQDKVRAMRKKLSKS